ncbi:tRNA pseudouridine(13) synthase TruD [Testudinibacter sp. TR-2022]|uniref:tRNA pseudouridine(13) synthase TruD n=1 Tax=Testudinibacter sp. TR-2022 TaxID=2585029 RepID=UPI001117CB9A|nr:tRNA pseudouridine(13) synthase TruD [Testudinibacter sp. TR-2022]TNH03461.1 tRNA pseudouridine(13) synthase TruD [Pasteurellaceae bacterium Phil31]TNH07826.1 tRNA pseudouridine(13) synthase TruD [Testudinibacter sp. TR-2022]TNH09093.1 tRNA pseudouridine(13) synthase TruD [Testudinibacter sp. TR-2022]TNH13049.1 tRNA pseudouridine(13) synthase TruD [Testudinibacter sp. TR-2022]TNH19338.1 tRNA pseudouridine(13) synthase TruD [Testudinibacter sp. TR-2022]
MSELQYLYGKPQQTARLKVEFSDFIVKEELGYAISGEGEFVALKVRKTNANTLFVGEKLAAFAGISAKNMSYAGLKDRHAVTEQWFCLHLPDKATPDFSQFALEGVEEGVEILHVSRHNRKIRIGSLQGNRFEILLRDLQQSADLIQRLQQIEKCGFPNYFMEQRFGRDGHNLTQALRWAQGEIQVKDRKKRSFYLSAARSELFNLMVSQRIEDQLTTTVLEGDVLQLQGSHSWFVATAAELPLLQLRLQQRDLGLTAALVGSQSLDSQAEAAERERAVVEQHPELLALMQQERLQNARRALLAQAQDFTWQFVADGLRLSFYLDSGSYATALVREVAQLEHE